MVRTHRWGPRGQRLRGQAPHGHWQTLTFLAALRHGRIDAPCLLDGLFNGESFKAYIAQFLVPALSPATWSSWTISTARRAMQCAGPFALSARGFCSCRATVPDLNPIEQVFAKLKTLLRNAAEPTVEATWQRMPLAEGRLYGCGGRR
jgi:hypothetical protein